MYMYMYVYVCVYIYIYVYVCIYIYIYIVLRLFELKGVRKVLSKLTVSQRGIQKGRSENNGHF